MQTLENAIQEKNILNESFKSQLANLLPQLNNYVGEKVITTTGQSKKFKYTLLPTKPFERAPYLEFSAYSIWLKIGSDAVYIGEMKYGVIVKLLPYIEICENWKLNEILEIDKINIQISRYKALKKQIESIESDFHLSKDFLKYA